MSTFAPVKVPADLLAYLRETARREIACTGGDLARSDAEADADIVKCEEAIGNYRHLMEDGPHHPEIVSYLAACTVKWDCGSDVEWPLAVGDKSWTGIERHMALIRLRDECGDGSPA